MAGRPVGVHAAQSHQARPEEAQGALPKGHCPRGTLTHAAAPMSWSRLCSKFCWKSCIVCSSERLRATCALRTSTRILSTTSFELSAACQVPRCAVRSTRYGRYARGWHAIQTANRPRLAGA